MFVDDPHSRGDGTAGILRDIGGAEFHLSLMMGGLRIPGRFLQSRTLSTRGLENDGRNDDDYHYSSGRKLLSNLAVKLRRKMADRVSRQAEVAFGHAVQRKRIDNVHWDHAMGLKLARRKNIAVVV